jgi:hypothetical protein
VFFSHIVIVIFNQFNIRKVKSTKIILKKNKKREKLEKKKCHFGKKRKKRKFEKKTKK